MTRISLRWILLWPILLAVSIGFVSLGLYVESTARSDQIAAVDDELMRVEQRVADAPPGRPVPDATSDIASSDDTDAPVQLVVGPDGDVLESLSSSNPFSDEQLRALAGTDGITTVDTDPRHRVLTAPGPDRTTLVSALPLDQVDASIASLRSSLLVGGLVIFVIVGGLVLMIATAVTRPVTKMSRTANLIADGALDTPIEPPTGSRETADLADDLQQMVTRLTASIDDATRARDDMRRFLADASHELRTPLTSIKGYSDLYARDMLDGPGHLDRAMDRVGSESARLTHMVNDMLQLASGEPTPDTELDDVDLTAVARDVVDDLAATHPDHRISLRIDAATVPSVTGDAARLHQCVLNLVANACHHGGDVVEVVIDVGEPSDVTVSVIDHGPGVAVDIADTIFRPFYRGDASRTRDGHGGAGLGLALAAQIAEQHGGRVTHHDTDGGGATFVLRLP